MSKIDELIQQLCPDGVEWKALGEVIVSLNTGLNPRQFFRLNTDDANNYYVTIREIHNQRIDFSDKTDKINNQALSLCNNRSNLQKGDILFSGTGTIGEMALIHENPSNWNIKEGVYAIKPKIEMILSKFLMYLLGCKHIRNCYMKKAAGGTVKSIQMAEMKKVRIPIPPLPIQQEIVRFLDNFTTLIAELQAEMQARKSQYEYYRNQLLIFSDVDNSDSRSHNKVEWKKLGDICKIKNGSDYKNLSIGDIPVYGTGGVISYVNTFSYDKPSVLIPRKGSIEKLYYVDTPFWNVDTIFYTIIKGDIIIPKFLFYYLQMCHLEQLNTAGGVPSLTQTVLNKILIPIPSLSEQARIVSILDRFDKLCNDLSEGLPAEIEARQKQYEYYRDKLLTFKEKI